MSAKACVLAKRGNRAQHQRHLNQKLKGLLLAHIKPARWSYTSVAWRSVVGPLVRRRRALVVALAGWRGSILRP